MEKVTDTWKFTKHKKYNAALLIIGGVTFVLFFIVIFLPQLFLMPLIPLISAGFTSLIFLSLYRFVLSKKYAYSLASFTKPIILAWIMPVYLLFFVLLLSLPNTSPANEDTLSVLISILIFTILCFILPVLALVLSVLAIIYAFKHFRASSDTEGRLISELPIMLSIIGLCATLGVFIFALFALL